ncbi:unnamed protein product, partial [Amoebophrya sp. A120]
PARGVEAARLRQVGEAPHCGWVSAPLVRPLGLDEGGNRVPGGWPNAETGGTDAAQPESAPLAQRFRPPLRGLASELGSARRKCGGGALCVATRCEIASRGAAASAAHACI